MHGSTQMHGSTLMHVWIAGSSACHPVDACASVDASHNGAILDAQAAIKSFTPLMACAASKA